MQADESAELKRLIARLDPAAVVRFYSEGESSLWTLSKPGGGFRGLGNILKLSPLRWGKGADFLSLIERAAADARAEGLEGIWGPLGYSTYFDYRLKTAGFEVPAFPSEPQNGPEHAGWFERAGFRPRQFYHSHEFELNRGVNTWVRAAAGIAGGSCADYRFDPTSAEEIMSLSGGLYDFTDRIFSAHFGYEPIGEELFREKVLGRLMPIACFHTSFLLRDGSGKVRGYSLNLRDPRDPQRLLLKTTAFDENISARTPLFFELMRRILENTGGRYRNAVFCLAARGLSTDRFIRRLKPRTVDYALFYRDLLV